MIVLQHTFSVHQSSQFSIHQLQKLEYHFRHVEIKNTFWFFFRIELHVLPEDKMM